jgi:hypothetical protein
MYDVRGGCSLVQSNGAVVDLLLDQSVPPGLANLPNAPSEIIGRAQVRGTGQVSMGLTGRVQGNDFIMQIAWNQGSVGEYRGVFNAGRLSGVCVEQTNPANQANWFIDRVFTTC